MTDEEYRKLRREEYERYMSMDFSDEIGKDDNPFLENHNNEEIDEYDDYSLFDRIKEFVKEHGVAIGIIAGVVVLAIITAIVIGILL